MALKVLSKSVANAKRLIAAGKVNRGAWAFSAADGNKLLGDDKDWDAYALWHLVEDTSQPEKTKNRYAYPYGKGGEVYTKALSSAEGYATKQGADDVAAAAKKLFDAASKDKEGDRADTLEFTGEGYEDLTAGLSDEEREEMNAIISELDEGHLDPADVDLELQDDEKHETDKDEDQRETLRALAKTRTANKERFGNGEDDGFEVEGKKVSRQHFLKKIGGVPQTWQIGSNVEPPEGEKEPEPGTGHSGALSDGEPPKDGQKRTVGGKDQFFHATTGKWAEVAADQPEPPDNDDESTPKKVGDNKLHWSAVLQKWVTIPAANAVGASGDLETPQKGAQHLGNAEGDGKDDPEDGDSRSVKGEKQFYHDKSGKWLAPHPMQKVCGPAGEKDGESKKIGDTKVTWHAKVGKWMVPAKEKSGDDGFRADRAMLLRGIKHDDRINSTDWMTQAFHLTEEGFLVGRAIVTNIGVFNYADGTGAIRRELRLPEEVFAFDSVDSLKLKPVTNDHPAGEVNSENVKTVQVGSIGSDPGFLTQWQQAGWDTEAMSDGMHLPIDMAIYDKQTIDDVFAGKTAISCGYTCDLEPADPGAMYLGQPYDYIQRNIRYNHVAVVDRARAGSAAQIRLDSADELLAGRTPREAGTMIKRITLDGVTYEAEEAVINTLVKEREARKAAETTVQAVTGERDSLKVRADEATKPERLKAAVEEKLRLLSAAKMARVEVKDDASDLDIKKAVVAKVYPAMKLDGKDEAYISPLFDGAIQAMESRNDATIRSIVMGGHLPGGSHVDEAVTSEYSVDEDVPLDALKDRTASRRDAMVERMHRDSRAKSYGVTEETAKDALGKVRADGAA